ncbi:MAG TPA: DUF1579 domain-containing protein [Bacteroidia bacterium]|nr:DUF1579 domain-containing protein [Bacteroidia bacterium]
MSEKFEKSLLDGTHHFLKSLEGNWRGITKVWFEPGKLADESPCSGTMKSVLGGRFILHEYQGSLEGKPIEGIAIIGCSLCDDKLQTAWVDSFHNGTAIMFSQNNTNASPYSVLAHYAGEPAWGWRTVITKEHADKMIITMFNIAPGGSDEKAVETIYERVK